MSAAALAPVRTLNDSALKQKLQEVRQTDNWSNWYYLIRSYLILAATIGGAVYFATHFGEWGLHWAWNIPVFLLAITIIGAAQHQLTVLAHEASHHTLFRTKLLNELVSDWFCMFPMLSTTHHYRLHHLAHHQFVNDPQRDPNVPQVLVNGHWNHFPMTRAEFWKELVKQLWPIYLIRYLRSQAISNAMPGTRSPYEKSGIDRSKMKIALRIGFAYLIGLCALLTGLVILHDPFWLGVAPIVVYAAVMSFYATIPGNWYSQYRVHPTYSMRVITLMRVTYVTLVAIGVAWLAYFYGRFAFYLYVLLWIVPMLTSFSLFMMLRQVVQHSNGDRGWLTNTRIFFVNLLVRDTILPYGQDIHLPHHMYATVPHYKLKDLHDYMMQYPEYRSEAIVVRGAVMPRTEGEPSILDVLGPDWARSSADVHIDRTVLDGETVEQKDAIELEVKDSIAAT